MANVTATTSVDQFTGTSGTTANADEILVTSQNQIQSGDLFNGGASTDTLRIGTSIDFTSILNGTTSGLRNLEIIRFNGADTATFRSDQFGAGLLSDTLTLRGTGGVQTIVINMVSGATTLNMTGWQFNTWTGGTDIISVVGSTLDDTIQVSSQHTTFDGGAGFDTVNYSNWGGGFSLTLNGSNWATATWNSGLTDRFRNVENLIGSTGDDTITGDGLDNALSGSAGNDTLNGSAGNDTLDGGAGNDTMTGGVGSDTFYVDSASDIVNERATDAGTDLVYSSVTFSAAGTNQDGIENVTLTGTGAINATGNALDNILTGNSANNVLTGNGGNDQLFGNGGADTVSGGDGDDSLDGGTGADAMTGGVGNDTYTVDNAGDVVVELSSDLGTDVVYSSVTFSAAGVNQSGIENIILTGTSNINATGNALANAITGNSGDNVIDGGTGADTMTGGAGNDTYTVEDTGDVVVELSSDLGTDVVYSSVTFSAAGVNQSGIENIILTGTSNINATGNALANVLTGNSGANTLEGGAGSDSLDGGLGADTLIGGLDADTYYVDDTGDVVIELASDAGTDLVYSAVTFSAAGLNQDGIENITLTGSATINATGNALNNSIVGNSSDNVIDGGQGADTMTGGAGNDTYYVEDAGDVVVELSSDTGTDVVYSSVTFSAAGINQSGIENITLTGTSAINATGNALNNLLIGNAAANVLSGGDGNDTLNGGLGNDTLTGGSSADVFVYDGYDTSAAQADVITDFSIAEGDKISFGPSGPASFEALAYLMRSSGSNTVFSGFWNSTAQTVTLTGVALSSLTADQFVFDPSTTARVVVGTAKADMIFGGLGDDTFSGGEGIDYIVGDAGSDLINGDGGNDRLFGGSGNDTLNGGEGADVLDGGTGADTMTGGVGADTYYVDNVGDVVNEYLADAGIDAVRASVTFALTGTASGVENLILIGPDDINGTGNDLNNVISGTSGANVLDGGIGNDTLQGYDGNDTLIGGDGNDTLDGGTGADIMTGGAGGDAYYVDNVSDVVNESQGQAGTDLVRASVTFALTGAASGVENLTLIGTADVNATGNTFNNTLDGNTGHNVLSGLDGNDILRGNAGNDTLIGGAGNDALYGGSGGDTFVFAPGSGRDVIYDFNVAEDKLDLGDYGIDTSAQFALIASNSGANVIVNFGGGNTVTIVNAQVSQFTNGLFV